MILGTKDVHDLGTVNSTGLTTDQECTGLHYIALEVKFIALDISSISQTLIHHLKPTHYPFIKSVPTASSHSMIKNKIHGRAT